jgi:hypothetical protein
MALVSFVLSYPAIGIMWFFNQFATKPGNLNWIILVILPLLISLVVSMFTVFGALSYNVIAKLGFCVSVRVESNPSFKMDSPEAGCTFHV